MLPSCLRKFSVPSIRGRNVARAQRSRVRRGENALQPVDFGNGLLNVHPCQSSSRKRESVKWKGIGLS